MGYEKSIVDYVNTYNALQELQNNPLLEVGAESAAGSALSGVVPIQRIADYDKLVENINTVLPGKLTELEDRLASLQSGVLAFFSGPGTGVTGAVLSTSKGDQILSVTGGTIVVEPYIPS